MPRQPQTQFEPGVFGDPVANIAEWGPCVRGGAGFCTHVLEERGSERMVFRPTVGAIIFYLTFLLMGCVALAVAVAGAIATDGHAAAPLFGFGALVFGGMGWVMLRRGTCPIVFDRTQGLFWKGRSASGLDACVDLSSIHALQVVSEYCGGKSKFYSYELNLVFADGRRSNVVDHGDLARLRRDAAALARFLGVKLWDASPNAQL